jgi:hypothetical protein
VDDIEPAAVLLEKLAGEMGDAAGARRAVRELAGIRLRERDELLQRLRGH